MHYMTNTFLNTCRCTKLMTASVDTVVSMTTIPNSGVAILFFSGELEGLPFIIILC